MTAPPRSARSEESFGDPVCTTDEFILVLTEFQDDAAPASSRSSSASSAASSGASSASLSPSCSSSMSSTPSCAAASAALLFVAAACVPSCTYMTLITKSFACRPHTARESESAVVVLAKDSLHLQNPSRRSSHSCYHKNRIQLPALQDDALLETYCTLPDSKFLILGSLIRPKGIAHLCPCGVGSLLRQGCIHIRAFLRLSRLLPLLLALHVLCNSPGVSAALMAGTAHAAHLRPLRTPHTSAWLAASWAAPACIPTQAPQA